MSKSQQHRDTSLFLGHQRWTKPEPICLGFLIAFHLGLLLKIFMKQKAERMLKLSN